MHYRHSFVVSLALSLGLFSSCAWAQSPQTGTKLSQEEELAQMRAEMAAMHQSMHTMQTRYQQQLNQMQDTVDTLQARVSRTPITVDALNKSSQAAPEAQEALGDSLLFGDDSNNAGNTGNSQPVAAGILSNTASGAVTVPRNTLQNFVPDISLLGDITGLMSPSRSVEGRNRFNLRETEIAIQSVIDPYARADFFLSVPDASGLEVEEGYITLLSLPMGFQAKVGKFRNAVGRLNRTHGPELPQVDRPNVLVNLFGEEGLAETGISLSHILPTPWFSQLEVEFANGDNEVLLGHGRFTKPTVVSHLKQFFDLAPFHSLEVGLSGAVGARGEADRGRLTGLGGVDLTYKWFPPNQTRGITWMTELLGAKMEAPVTGRDFAWGGYSFIETRLTPRVYVGVRADYSQIPLSNTSEFAIAPYFNFWQSEFGRFRAEYKHTFANQAPSTDALWLQYTATLGTHQPHPF